MALNDEKERLDLAEDYLLKYSPNSQEFEAALEHVRWVHANKEEWQPRCEAILASVVLKRRDEKHTMAVLRSFK